MYDWCVLFVPIFRKHRSLIDILPQVDDVSLDLLHQLLQFSPDKRATAEMCLTHPFVNK